LHQRFGISPPIPPAKINKRTETTKEIWGKVMLDAYFWLHIFGYTIYAVGNICNHSDHNLHKYLMETSHPAPEIKRELREMRYVKFIPPNRHIYDHMGIAYCHDVG